MRKPEQTIPRRRKAPREERRLQLVKATIRAIARHGLSDVTISIVAREARLSQGIINLHFKSKDRLLVATLEHVAQEYRATWRRALEGIGNDPVAKVARLVDVDFDSKVCHPNKLAVWFAFWGSSKSRPTYRKICADHDRSYHEMMTGLCAQIVQLGAYTEVEPPLVATGLAAMTEGLWLDLLVDPDAMTPLQAKAICLAYLASLFPHHFKRQDAA